LGTCLSGKTKKEQVRWYIYPPKSHGIEEKRNLEPLKGNSFACSNTDYLNQNVRDVNINLGDDISEANEIINNLVVQEKKNYEKFVDENPDILLPTNLNVEIELHSESEAENEHHTPPGSF
jgi:hypothetical protein